MCVQTHTESVCTKWGGPQHDSSSGSDKCGVKVTPFCKNCCGKHLATDLRCPAREAATQRLRAKLLQATTEASFTTGLLGSPIDLNHTKMAARPGQCSPKNMRNIDDSATSDHVALGITNTSLCKNPSLDETPLPQLLPFDKNDNSFPPLLGEATVPRCAAHIFGKKVNKGESPWEALHASKSPEGTCRSSSPNTVYTKNVEILIHHLERIEESQKQLTASLNAIIDEQGQLLQLTKNLIHRYNGI
ncbi:hypothetical protein HPB48_009691 [Haemaphysalis longicornis]|uniref:Uncharacterized protein n=1 Tax=Haemaphysalis longicornis TaxID=44386 RepID=A0A9J6FNG8_HAELO|nr:hypothetical protein HPB48_009691 [Haemaphysalis longicornis]